MIQPKIYTRNFNDIDANIDVVYIAIEQEPVIENFIL